MIQADREYGWPVAYRTDQIGPVLGCAPYAPVVDSSAMDAIAYDPDLGLLLLRLPQSRRARARGEQRMARAYLGVEPRTVDALHGSSSKGAFVHLAVQGRHPVFSLRANAWPILVYVDGDVLLAFSQADDADAAAVVSSSVRDRASRLQLLEQALQRPLSDPSVAPWPDVLAGRPGRLVVA